MPILRSERTYPLTLKAAAQYAINAGITAAYDFQGDPNNAYAGGNGAPHVGANTYTKTSNPTLVQAAPGIFGRDTSEGRTVVKWYTGGNIGALGFGAADGKGAFTIHRRIRTPTANTTTSAGRALATYRDAASNNVAKLYMVEVAASNTVYFKWELMSSTNSLPSTSTAGQTARQRPHNTIVDIYLTRVGDVLTYYLDGELIATITLPSMLAYNTNPAAGGPIGFSSGDPTDMILIDETYWNRALSDAEIMQHRNDPYAGYNNTAVVANGLTVTNPLSGSSVNSEGFNVGGTYAGTVPTALEYRFNGGAWVALLNTVIGGGNFSGTTGAVANGTGQLDIRMVNSPTTIGSVTSITTVTPAPTVTITDQQPPNGQSVTFSVTTTRATNVAITFTGAGNGAVTQAPVSFAVVNNAGTFTVNGIPPGDYTTTVVATGAGGASPTVQGSPFSILGVSGGGSDASAGSDPGDTVKPVFGAGSLVATPSENAVTLAYPVATDNSGEIKNYEYSFGGEYMSVGLATTYKITQLNPVTTYTVYVRARDYANNLSDVLSATFTTPVAQKPGSPTDVTATVTGEQTVSVAFTPSTAPIVNPVTGFNVTASNGQTVTVAASPATMVMPVGFVGTFTVTATNSVGTSAPSAPSAQVTTGPTPVAPAAPTNVVAVAGNEKATVSFTAPAQVFGYPTTGFTVFASTGQQQSGTQSPITLTLPNGTPVSFTVVAHNTAGTSPASAPSAVVTPTLFATRMYLVEDSGVDVLPGTLVHYALFDVGPPSAFSVPSSAGTEAVAFDSTVVLDMPNTTLATGQNGWVVLSYGGADNAERYFVGEVPANTAPVKRVMFAQTDAGNGSGQEEPPIFGQVVPLSPSRRYIFSDPVSTEGHGPFWNVANPAKPKGVKDPDSTIDISFDIVGWLADSQDTYASHTITLSGGLQLASTFHDNGVIGVFVRGGTPGTAGAKVTCRVKTASDPAREDDRTVYLKITPR